MTDLLVLDIVYDTTVDGPGFRTAIYAAGCIHQCYNCHNPQSWNKNEGTRYSIEYLIDIIKKNEFAHVTLTGGDPLIQVQGFRELSEKIKLETNKNIWCYTGFVYEQIAKSKKLAQILPFIDVLVDGKYVDEYNDKKLMFKGSSNQRIIDIKKTIKTGKIINWERI
ncbi:anaerobic ribonucleoside-triphosphate reductase activating protein [Apibacter raozihei]|uniref:anaerobic ribonucleoside-triphosphate reductase activating protein n=1 Tax=Apibacter raozihei TaxID=2500547 RepID=UPI000FE2C4C4|nr:anaerobic ribonucleoside-triphosphate reductase activating protein [Apibacter raozihei]